jgi:hypothetical protein
MRQPARHGLDAETSLSAFDQVARLRGRGGVAECEGQGEQKRGGAHAPKIMSQAVNASRLARM